MGIEELTQKFIMAFRKPAVHIDEKISIFLIGETHILRVSEGEYNLTLCVADYGYAKIHNLDRGKILESFAKLEFLVNESLNLYFLSTPTEKSKNLSNLIKKLPFRQRIESLKNFDLISASAEKRLKDLTSTRNILAHEWNEKTAKYKNKNLTNSDTFENFNNSLLTSFKILIEQYKQLQNNKCYLDYLQLILNELEQND
ncbi:MAG: hypothetical protein ACRBEE_00840 [Arenicella sp.]